MHLLPCKRPTAPLESAPRTALRADSAQERWEGYWDTTDESYYARCVRADGSDQWYRVADERTRPVKAKNDVLVLRRPGVTRTDVNRMAVFGRSGGRTMLVGTSRRRTRARDAARGGSR